MRDEDRLRATQAACPHRFELVGYRNRVPRQSPVESALGVGGRSTMDAVLVCPRCTKEHLAGVTQMLPAPTIDTGRRYRGSLGSPDSWYSGQVHHISGPNDLAYRPKKFEPFEALDTIAKTVEMDDELDRDDADTIQRQLYALRAYITGRERS